MPAGPQVLYLARGRCQRCGKTIKVHGITLLADHKKKPRRRVSIDDRENLWATCEACHAVRKSGLPHPTVGVRPRIERCQTSISQRETPYEL
ncbi:MAG: HNH endonuclease [Terriglobia bacterium]